MKYKYFLLPILILSAFPVSAENLSMEYFIGKVLDIHPELKVFSSNEEISKIRSESALSMEKWVVSMKPFINYFGEASAYQYKSSETQQYGTELSLKTPLGFSGGEIGISGSSTAEYNDPLSQDQSEELFKQKISVFYRQSLLKKQGDEGVKTS